MTGDGVGRQLVSTELKKTGVFCGTSMGPSDGQMNLA